MAMCLGHARLFYLPFRTTSIGRDNYTISPFINILFYPFKNGRLGVQVVNGDIEEPLDLRGVEIHGDDMVSTSDGQHIRNQFGRDWSTTLWKQKPTIHTLLQRPATNTVHLQPSATIGSLEDELATKWSLFKTPRIISEKKNQLRNYAKNEVLQMHHG